MPDNGESDQGAGKFEFSGMPDNSNTKKSKIHASYTYAPRYAHTFVYTFESSPKLVYFNIASFSNMLLLLLLCISWTWSAVLTQNPPKLPHTPDEISVSFICTAGSGTDTQEASVGEIYYSKILNKGAVVIKRSGYTEHLVFNYNTSQVLVTTEKIAKHCDYVDISSFVDGSYNPKVLISMLTNDTLKFIADENSFGDIPGKLWQGNAQGFGETINVTYNELPWTFSSSYITNVSRPISLIGMDNKGAVLGYYFFGATNSVPHEAFMPPRGIFCRSFDDSKESGPTLPLAFRVDAEVYKEDTNYGSKIFYNGNLNVSRNDIITDYENRHSMITDRNYGEARFPLCVKKLPGKGSSQWEFLAMFWKRSLDMRLTRFITGEK
uniref:Uncharacterized protein n=1 Tax=Strigamia maritima TaxID=126957 RepID=T1ILL2_STRMM